MSNAVPSKFPAASAFVVELQRRVDKAYPDTLRTIARSLVKLGADQSLLLSWMRHDLTRAGFLLGCAAEEIASVGGLFEPAREKRFIREVVACLQAPAKPMPAKRVGPALRRLVKEFKAFPSRSRTRTVQFMLELQQLEEIGARLESDPSRCLAIECTVASDEVAGLLLDQITNQECVIPYPGRFRRGSSLNQLQL